MASGEIGKHMLNMGHDKTYVQMFNPTLRGPIRCCPKRAQQVAEKRVVAGVLV